MLDNRNASRGSLRSTPKAQVSGATIRRVLTPCSAPVSVAVLLRAHVRSAFLDFLGAGGWWLGVLKEEWVLEGGRDVCSN